jgi:hypothetical protein
MPVAAVVLRGQEEEQQVLAVQVLEAMVELAIILLVHPVL